MTYLKNNKFFYLDLQKCLCLLVATNYNQSEHPRYGVTPIRYFPCLTMRPENTDVKTRRLIQLNDVTKITSASTHYLYSTSLNPGTLR